MGIPEVARTWQTKKAIKNDIIEANEKEIKELVENTRKVNDRWQEDSKVRDYLSYMNLRNARQWKIVRSRMTKGVKKNRSSTHKNNMECRCCDSGDEEKQEHLEVCVGTENQRRYWKTGKSG